MLLGILGFFAHRRDGFETDQTENRDTTLDDDEHTGVPVDDGLGGVVIKEGPDPGLGVLEHAAFVGSRVNFGDCLGCAGFGLVGGEGGGFSGGIGCDDHGIAAGIVDDVALGIGG